MPFVEWDESFMTGVQPFDEHHQILVGLLNKSYDDFICGAPDDTIGTVLNELVTYAGYHFAAEEAWMRDNSYTKLAEHTHEHDTFSQGVMALQDDFHNGKKHIALDTLTFLKRWIRAHLLESDADYRHFIFAGTHAE